MGLTEPPVICTKPIRVLEAAYRLEGDDTDWLGGVVRAMRDDLDRGAGVLAYLSRLDGPHVLMTSPLVHRGVDPALLDRIRSSQPPPLVTEYIRRHMTIFGSVRQTFGGGSEPAGTLRRRRLGFDSLAAITQGDDSLVLQVIAASASEVRVTARTAAAWRKVLLHLGAALRLRQRLGAREALLTPNGRLADATEGATTPDARRALVEAVRNLEQARSRRMRTDPEHALTLWQGLVSGRWSLVDHFEAGGRRYVAAHENRPGLRDPRALGPFERACVHYVTRGTKPRDIAYALGTTPASVSSALARAARRLGLASTAMLATLAQHDVDRLEVALGGGEVLDVAVVHPRVHEEWRRRVPPSELAVAELAVLGLSDGEIAVRRQRSARTVSNQLRVLYRRLGVGSRAELIELLSKEPRRRE